MSGPADNRSMEEANGSGVAELLADGLIEIDFNYHVSDEAVLQSQTKNFFNSLL